MRSLSNGRAVLLLGHYDCEAEERVEERERGEEGRERTKERQKRRERRKEDSSERRGLRTDEKRVKK
jgi:hypothetical protein